MRFKSILIICVFFTLTWARQRNPKHGKEESAPGSDREGKIFSLFTIVNFKNEPCQSTDSLASGSTQYRNGTCFTASECGSKGGSSKGSCAAGFGVCCIFTKNSDSDTTVNYNDTYLQNPNYPSAYGETNTLTYTINKCSNDICWLRLDFETFTTVGPTDTEEMAGYTCTDMMTVTTSSGQSVPTLCGDLTGQHIYIDLGTGSSDSANLALAFSGTNTNRKWDIKVAQIPCGARYAPPNGCLQYQTGITGQITTFNFPTTSGPHLPSQDYSHCIRQEQGFCCVEYSVCSDSDDQFSLDNEVVVGDAAAITGTSCFLTDATTVASGDYITIEASGNDCNVPTNSKYCGQKLNAQNTLTFSTPICDCTAPFAVGIYTDANQDTKSATIANRGVCLNYRQLPC